jgi:protoporphyrinogen oxidase
VIKRNMKKKYIIGGGIAGLIFAFYNKDYKIITKDLGGQFNNNFPLGPRFFEDTPESRRLLRDLEIEIIPKKIKVGYFYNNLIHNCQNSDFLKKYYLKSRGKEYSNEKIVMNNGKKEMNILQVDFVDIISKLVEKLSKKIIVDNIIKITDSEIITLNRKFVYEKIINTIPLPIMLNYLNKDSSEYSSASVTFVLFNESFFDFKDYSFVYFSDSSLFHRMTKIENGIVAEFFGEIEEKKLKNMFLNNFVDSKIVKNSQIITGNPCKIINKKIINFGRYGVWDREYKTEKVIKEAIQYGRKKI